MVTPDRQRRRVVALVVTIVLGYVGYVVASSAVRATGQGPTVSPAASATRPSPSTLGAQLSHLLALAKVRTTRTHPVPKDVAISPFDETVAQWQRLLALAEAAGVTVIGTPIDWAQIEPTRAGPVEWTLLDGFVSAVRARHLQLRLQIFGFPQWARSPGRPSQAAAPWLAPSSPAELGRWSAFVADVATHFRDMVAYFEIWKEPNVAPYWYPRPDPAGYGLVLEASYVAIHRADPTAKVVFGGMRGNDVGFLEDVYSALDRLFPRVARADHHFFDVLGTDPFSGGRSPALNTRKWISTDAFGLIDENFLGFELLHVILTQHGEGAKPIYITGFGYPTTGGSPAVDDSERASYLRVAWELAAHVPYVIGLSWYSLVTTPFTGPGWGILAGSYPWKATETFRALASVGSAPVSPRKASTAPKPSPRR